LYTLNKEEMLLIADGGSTKTNWCVIDSSGNKSTFNSEGFNPYFVNTQQIVTSLKAVLPASLQPEKIEEIFFYGAGVQNQDKAMVLKDAFTEIFPKAKAFVGHDLLASARALLGFEEGFAAILGTGTNSCLYNGSEITKNVDSGAHILGDEGSGFYIGKRLLIDYLRGGMPAELSKLFQERYNLTSDDVHEAVYSQPLANRYCASFSRFIESNYKDFDYTRNLLETAFNDFFKNIVSLYPNYTQYKFNCIGSVGYTFKDVLEPVAGNWGMEFGKVIKSPLEDLVNYHLVSKNLQTKASPV